MGLTGLCFLPQSSSRGGVPIEAISDLRIHLAFTSWAVQEEAFTSAPPPPYDIGKFSSHITILGGG